MLLRFLGDRPINVVRFWGSKTFHLTEIEDGIVFAGLGKMYALNQSDPFVIPKFADHTSLTVIDEAHQAIAPSYKLVLESLYTNTSS